MAVIEDITKIEPYFTDENGDHQKISYQTQFNTVVNSDGTTLDEKITDLDEKITDLEGISLIQTLSAGSTTLIFEDEAITDDKTYEYFSSVYGVNAKTITITNGILTITFKEQSTDIDVKVVIK